MSAPFPMAAIPKLWPMYYQWYSCCHLVVHKSYTHTHAHKICYLLKLTSFTFVLRGHLSLIAVVVSHHLHVKDLALLLFGFGDQMLFEQFLQGKVCKH